VFEDVYKDLENYVSWDCSIFPEWEKQQREEKREEYKKLKAERDRIVDIINKANPGRFIYYDLITDYAKRDNIMAIIGEALGQKKEPDAKTDDRRDKSTDATIAQWIVEGLEYLNTVNDNADDLDDMEDYIANSAHYISMYSNQHMVVPGGCDVKSGKSCHIEIDGYSAVTCGDNCKIEYTRNWLGSHGDNCTITRRS